ncbi:MAG: hypothetical protein HZB33_05470 [Nitrospirae bacterium]|nr:hypothetical protein [Nitrospirota bacterium]
MSSRLSKVIALFFMFAVALSFLWPIFDIDFPWHVKTGEYIYTHGEIPKSDPFTIGSNGSPTEKFILSQYWLAQVLFYILFKAYGPIAIVLIKSLIFTSLIAILWASMKETPVVITAAVLYVAVMILMNYTGERPQLFSFLFALLTIVILERYRLDGSRSALFFLPIVMLIWANCHGGFILGNVLIALACSSETIKYLLFRRYTSPLNDKQLMLLLFTGLFSILISYLNPNSHYAYSFAIGGIGPASQIMEYQTPLAETLGAFAKNANFLYWSLMGYVLVILALNLRKTDITHLALVSFTLALSLTAVRYVPFFVLCGVIIAGRYTSGIGASLRYRHKEKVVLLLNIAVLIAVMIWAGGKIKSWPGFSNLSKIGWVRFNPQSAAVFINQNIEKANIFNSHNTGSWLIFGLYPKFRLFMDTRAYNSKLSALTTNISFAVDAEYDATSTTDALGELLPKDYGTIKIGVGQPPASGKTPIKRGGHTPFWREQLLKYDIDLIIHEGTNYFTGEIYPLPLRLIKDDEWKLIYLDGRVLIFVRDVPRFRDVIERFSLDKSKVYDEIGMENSPKLGSAHAGVYSSLAFALLMKGTSDDATVRKYIKQALYLDPNHLVANYLQGFMALKDKKLNTTKENE